MIKLYVSHDDLEKIKSVNVGTRELSCPTVWSIPNGLTSYEISISSYGKIKKFPFSKRLSFFAHDLKLAFRKFMKGF
ncbi:MAG: hypothetical protein AB7H97_06330 [Pseudobdellovibrionaceae bacterium]